tara:strand:+ start:3681 stop:4454 length:774 start_codon:yes stop_codon:yes gene_type:complete
MDVDVTEAVSEIKSLTGVPGRLMDAMLACLDLSLSTVEICGTVGVEPADNGGGTSVFGVGITRRVRGATVRLIGDPVTAAAGLAGTDVVAVVGNPRIPFAWASTFCELGTGDPALSGVRVAAVMSSLPGGCRLEVGAGVVTGVGDASLVSAFASMGSFCGVLSVAIAFFLLLFTFMGSLLIASDTGFFSSSFCRGFLCPSASSLTFLVATPAVGVFGVLVLRAAFVGVSGCGFAGVVTGGWTSPNCFVVLALEGVVV